MKILVADDDSSMIPLVEHLFRPYGTVHVVDAGDEAVRAFVAALDDEGFDLVCMDIDMPGPSGPRAVTSIRGFERSSGITPEKAAKILMLTACDDKKTILSSFRNGCDGYIIKPLTAEVLETQMKRLGLKRAA